ncbi:MAG: hypothetical protein VX278_05470 [Myxococcota bacterium]|nr:hypothetical protein [Myxococcota bacterium]
MIRKGSLPKQRCPIHPLLGTALLEGIVDGDICWLERTDADILLKEYDTDKGLDRIFEQIEEALAFLHQCDASHGSVDDEHIAIRGDGNAVLIGVGEKHGSIEADREDFQTLKSRYLDHSQGEYKPVLIPVQHSLEEAPDILLEVLHAAQRHPRDRPDYFDDPSLTDATESSQTKDPTDLGEPTGQQNRKALILGELLHWTHNQLPLLEPPAAAPQVLIDGLFGADPMPTTNSIPLPQNVDHATENEVTIIEGLKRVPVSRPVPQQPYRLFFLILFLFALGLFWVVSG